MPTITEADFAQSLLRYTILTKEENEEYLARLNKRIPHVQVLSYSSIIDSNPLTAVGQLIGSAYSADGAR